MSKPSEVSEMREVSDEILRAKVEKLNEQKLQGWSSIKEFTDEMTKYDPRIVSVAVKSVARWRDWISTDQQQQQQQQQK